MDDSKIPTEGAGFPLRGPHRHPDPSASFVPMRLVLFPAGLAVELTLPDMVVGRHSEADITLRLPDVSRRHCRFVYADNQWHVFDLQSLNGVFVNHERVQQATLQHRDLVRIGSYTFEVDLQPGSPTVQLPGKGAGHPDRILGSISEALPKEAPEQDPDKLAS